MSTLQNCLHYLKAYGVRYAHTTHSPAYTAEDVAAAEHIATHSMAKTVVCRDENGFLMCAVPADSNVDMEQLRLAVGTTNISLAEETDLFLLFPAAELGAMPPLGNLFGLPVYVDRELANQEFITFNAGTHRDVIHMRMADFLQLVRPVVGNFCEPRFTLNFA